LLDDAKEMLATFPAREATTLEILNETIETYWRG